jgi:hypothetical protein
MIPKDKVMHFIVGAAIASVALLAWGAASALGLAPITGAPAAAALAATVAGVVKEGCDYLDNKIVLRMHGVEWLDAVATALPGFILGAVAYLIVGPV